MGFDGIFIEIKCNAQFLYRFVVLVSHSVDVIFYAAALHLGDLMTLMQFHQHV